MKLILIRFPSGKTATIGELFVDGVSMCNTLEDPIREIPGAPVNRWKIPGDTAIPQGRYSVDITFSPRFGRDLPLVLAVPGFTGIRFHAGNTSEDTEGCILVGTWNGGERLHDSRKALEALIDLLDVAKSTDRPITLEVVNPEE